MASVKVIEEGKTLLHGALDLLGLGLRPLRLLDLCLRDQCELLWRVSALINFPCNPTLKGVRKGGIALYAQHGMTQSQAGGASIAPSWHPLPAPRLT